MTEPERGPTQVALVVPFSKEWCEKAILVWEDVVLPSLVEPYSYNYAVEFGEIDTGAVCQLRADRGHITTWDPGKTFSDEQCDFIVWATSENWRRIGEGKLDPVAALASRRVHLRKGPMPILIKEANAFKGILAGFGRIPTAW